MTTRDAWAAAIRTELNSITSHTTTQTTHRATLAGGITVTLDPAVFGATLTLSDTLRALTLTLTQEQVAALSGVTTSAVARLERGETAPQRSTVQAIETALYREEHREHWRPR